MKINNLSFVILGVILVVFAFWSATDTSFTSLEGIEDQETLKKINAWVGQIAGSYVMPEEAVHQLRNALMKIGLTFGEAAMEGNSGSVELPLTLYGGRFGKDVDTPHDEFVQDDGISHQKEGGLALVLNYSINEDNSFKVTASIK